MFVYIYRMKSSLRVLGNCLKFIQADAANRLLRARVNFPANTRTSGCCVEMRTFRPTPEEKHCVNFLT